MLPQIEISGPHTFRISGNGIFSTEKALPKFFLVVSKCTLSFLERFPFYIVIKLGKMTKNGRDKQQGQQVFGFYEKS